MSSNWARATTGWAPQMLIAADDLVAIGIGLGPEVAERVYRALAREPVDASGQRVDWLVIRARIVRGRSA